MPSSELLLVFDCTDLHASLYILLIFLALETDLPKMDQLK